jgi:hypothetical protein
MTLRHSLRTGDNEAGDLRGEYNLQDSEQIESVQ